MDFENIYQTRPDKKEVGSSGYSRLKHLHEICLREKPTTIIESGTWKGNSSYLFRHACPDATIICHDINFGNLFWSDDSIRYVQEDIENYKYDELDKENTLLFFDDHISQESRLNWCRVNGFSKIVFDDNVSAEEAATLKNPAVPTLQMIEFESREYVILPNYGQDKQTYLTWVLL